MSQNTDGLRATLRAEIARRNLSIAEIAAHTRISEPALRRRLRGDVDWSVAELAAVAEMLQIPLASLFTNTAAP